MTGIAIRRYALAFHLLRVHVISVRESFQPELAHLCRKTYPRPLRIYGAGVTDYAHLARRVRKIFRVTIDAGCVTRENRRHGIIGALMTKTAILSLGLMFGPVMIERRFALDDHRFLYVKDRLNRSRFRRRSLRCAIGRRLFGAAAGIDRKQ